VPTLKFKTPPSEVENKKVSGLVPLHTRVFKITGAYVKNKVMEMGSSRFFIE
jgi:hypothetical protein